MTDSNQEQVTEQNSSSAAPAVSHETSMQQEKMVPQSRVDNYVRDGWSRGYEKAKAEFEKQAQAPQAPAHQSQNLNDLDSILETKLQEKLRAIQEQEARKQYDAQMQHVANDFVGKINAQKSKYPDFDQKVGQIGYESISHLIPAINQMDNAIDIVYELANNPNHIANITSLANIRPELGLAGLNKLAQSIKRNEQAKGQHFPAEPLSPLSHSNTGKDSGSNSINDFKKADWLRG